MLYARPEMVSAANDRPPAQISMNDKLDLPAHVSEKSRRVLREAFCRFSVALGGVLLCILASSVGWVPSYPQYGCQQ